MPEQTMGSAVAVPEFSKEINKEKGKRAFYVTVASFVGGVALTAAIDAVVGVITNEATVTAILAPLVADHPAYAFAVPMVAGLVAREAAKFLNKRKFQKEHGKG